MLALLKGVGWLSPCIVFALINQTSVFYLPILDANSNNSSQKKLGLAPILPQDDYLGCSLIPDLSAADHPFSPFPHSKPVAWRLVSDHLFPQKSVGERERKGWEELVRLIIRLIHNWEEDGAFTISPHIHNCHQQSFEGGDKRRGDLPEEYALQRGCFCRVI